MTTQEKLKAARERRGWTIWEATQHMRGVRDQQLRNLEGVGNRPTEPEEIKVKTMAELVRVYWPDLDFGDFCPETPLRFTPRDSAARRRLLGHLGA